VIIHTQYSYQATLQASERVRWRVEDILNDEQRLDFDKPFLPESLARSGELEFLSPRERLILNQVRGNTYLGMFGLVEEFILPFLLDHVRPLLHGDDDQVRAILQFAGEEAKHIQLFRRFSRAFQEGFGTRCDLIGPPSEIAKAVLGHHPLGVALAILQIEWMTQSHYVESVKDAHDLDPCIKSLLKHHWMEEAQHAKLDTLLVATLAERLTPREIHSALGEYLEIGAFIAGGLAQQVEFDREALEIASGRLLSDTERNAFRKSQLAASCFTFLGSGMVHPNFRETLRALGGDCLRRVDEVAPHFC
jgi:hypothetical protein